MPTETPFNVECVVHGETHSLEDMKNLTLSCEAVDRWAQGIRARSTNEQSNTGFQSSMNI